MIHSKLLTKFIIILSLFGLLGFTANPKYITKSDKYHIVKKGDTLYSIGKKYGLSVENLKRINNLTSDRILVGQKIHFVEKKTSQQYYVTKREIPESGHHLVQKGETLYRISKMYDLSLIELMEFNQLSSYTIKAGEKIWLKSVQNKTVITEKTINYEIIEKKPKPKEKPKYHIVKKGENLYRIGSEYNLSIYELKQYNNLSSNTIFVGQKLSLGPTDNYSEKYIKPKTKITQKDVSKYNLLWPCKGSITSQFGLRDGKPHKGIDIACPTGTRINAVLDGEVAYTGWQRGYGNVIILKHDYGLMTVYAHNDENLVAKGDKVSKGEKVGTVGNTGNTTGSHIHFEVRLEGRAMDPEKFLP